MKEAHKERIKSGFKRLAKSRELSRIDVYVHLTKSTGYMVVTHLYGGGCIGIDKNEKEKLKKILNKA